MKKIIALLASVIMLSLMGCGAVDSWKDHVYKWKEITPKVVGDGEMLSRYIMNNGKNLYYMLTSQENSSYRIVGMSLNGFKVSSVKIEGQSNMQYFDVDRYGNIYAVFCKTKPICFPTNSDYYLVKINTRGKELWRRPLTEEGKEYAFGITAMEILTDGNIVIAGAEGIVLYDHKGEIKGSIESPETGTIWQIIQLKDGNIMIFFKNESEKTALGKLDFSTGKLYEECIFPREGWLGALNYNFFSPGIEYDLIFSDAVGIKGYNIGDEHATEIMNSLDSGYDMFFASLIQTKKHELYAIRTDEEELKITKFTKPYFPVGGGKKLITLGCFGKNEMLHEEVIRFNKSNHKYRVRIKDYRHFSPRDKEACMAKLMEDITYGNAPDIVIDKQLPIEIYGSKNMFEDLYTYIDKDKKLNRSDFSVDILKAYENDGMLLLLVPGFRICAATGKIVSNGKETGWSLEELKEAMKIDGLNIEYDIGFAMPERAVNKDGAWAFMRYYLTDEYQNTLGDNEWPLSIKRVEELKEEAEKE